MFFISVAWKLSVNLKPKESEGLNGVYGLKFVYLVENEKPYCTQWYADGKYVIVLFTSRTANR